jgi:hypothetical protein
MTRPAANPSVAMEREQCAQAAGREPSDEPIAGEPKGQHGEVDRKTHSSDKGPGVQRLVEKTAARSAAVPSQSMSVKEYRRGQRAPFLGSPIPSSDSCRVQWHKRGTRGQYRVTAIGGSNVL